MRTMDGWMALYAGVHNANSVASTDGTDETQAHSQKQCSRKRVQQLKKRKSHVFLDFDKNVKNVESSLRIIS